MRAVVVVIAGIFLMGLAIGPAPATAAPPRPRISVTLDNGKTKVHSGGRAEYVIRVRNHDDTSYQNVLIAELLPQTLTFKGSNFKPSVRRPNEIQWRRDLPAHGEVVVKLHGSISKTGALAKLTTTACVRASDSAPLACDSDSDAIGPPKRRPTWIWWSIAISGAAAATAGVLFGWRWRRRALASAAATSAN